MTVRNIKLENAEAILARLDADVLLQPEFDAALATFQKRVERQGKGLGAQKNTLMSTVDSLSLQTKSTTNYPRTVGTAWGRKNESIIKAMAGRVVKSAITKIEARWASEAAP